MNNIPKHLINTTDRKEQPSGYRAEVVEKTVKISIMGPQVPYCVSLLASKCWPAVVLVLFGGENIIIIWSVGQNLATVIIFKALWLFGCLKKGLH